MSNERVKPNMADGITSFRLRNLLSARAGRRKNAVNYLFINRSLNKGVKLGITIVQSSPFLPGTGTIPADRRVTRTRQTGANRITMIDR